MKIRTFIAEDEPHSLARLQDLLSAFSDISVIGHAGDGINAARLINELRPDLVFLDIRMPGASGFDVLARIHHRPMVIFVTAYDDFAVKAFEENAVDYILKPTSKERLAVAVDRVTKLNFRMSEGDIERIRLSLRKYSYLRRFITKVKSEIEIIPENEVCFFKAEDKYVLLHTWDKRYFIDTPLKELEVQLDPEKFCRVHRGYIVSLDKIVRLKKWFHSEYILEMADQEQSRLKVSRNCKELLLKRLKYSRI